MAYSVKHQVFVSSTFADLVAERAEVIQAIWEMDCIPTGMEAFVASNESQWDVIKRVIDECDYYVLILGGRYGSLTTDGISYTEKEYRYAKALGMPILAFTHANPDEIPSGKTEKNGEASAKLVAFRAEVMEAYPIRKWSTAAELGGVVSRSLLRETKINPRPGWIRNDGTSPIALLEQINKLTEENRELRESLAAAQPPRAVDIDQLASGSDKTTLRGSRHVTTKTSSREYRAWTASASWDDLFKDLGPALSTEATEDELIGIVARFHGWADLPDGESSPRDADVDLECWSEVIVQFRALGLVTHGTKKRAVSDKARYWKITIAGDNLLLRLLARKKPATTTRTPDANKSN